MKIFSAIFVSAIVAITIGRCRAEFLLVQVDDATGKGNIYFFIKCRSKNETKINSKFC